MVIIVFELFCWRVLPYPSIYNVSRDSAQERAGRQDCLSWHQRYDFDVIPYLNLFCDNELFKAI